MCSEGGRLCGAGTFEKTPGASPKDVAIKVVGLTAQDASHVKDISSNLVTLCAISQQLPNHMLKVRGVCVDGQSLQIVSERAEASLAQLRNKSEGGRMSLDLWVRNPLCPLQAYSLCIRLSGCTCMLDMTCPQRQPR